MQFMITNLSTAASNLHFNVGHTATCPPGRNVSAPKFRGRPGVPLSLLSGEKECVCYESSARQSESKDQEVN
jgi:hypothetical protein